MSDKILLVLVALFVCVGLLVWLVTGSWMPLAVPAVVGAAVNASRRDKQVDAVLAAAADDAGRREADKAGDWTDKTGEDRPRLNLAVLPLIMLALPIDTPIRQPECVPAHTYGDYTAKAGFGLWLDPAQGAMWCPCVAAVVRDVTRVPAGCALDTAVLGYTLDAHKDVVSDLAKASTLIQGYTVQLGAVRRARDDLSEALTAKDRALVTARTQRDKYKAETLVWFTWRSVTMSIVSGVAATYTYGKIARWIN